MSEYLDRHKDKLKELLSKDRLQHSKSVAMVAEKLALKYGASTKKAIAAALLHDCAKGLSDQEYFNYLAQVQGYSKIKQSEFVREKYNTLHAVVSAKFAEEYFDIEDEEILDAIRFHTNGCSKIGILSKIIYLADVIEPLREASEDLRKVRKILEYEGINKAIIYEVKCKFKNLIKRDKKISSDLLGMYNSIISEMEDTK